MNVVQGLGQVDWDDFDNLQEVMTWMITIITFDQFIEPVESAGWLRHGQLPLRTKYLSTKYSISMIVSWFFV